MLVTLLKMRPHPAAHPHQSLIRKCPPPQGSSNVAHQSWHPDLSKCSCQKLFTRDPNGEILKSVKNIKDLGITISYDLSWSNHIYIVVNKANKVLRVIKRVLGSNSVNKFPLLFVIVRPILEYAALVWCPFLVKDIVSLEKNPKESFETGSRPKERRNGLRGTLSHFKVVTIKEYCLFL